MGFEREGYNFFFPRATFSSGGKSEIGKVFNRNLTNSRSIEMPMTIIIQQEEMKVCKIEKFLVEREQNFLWSKKIFFPFVVGRGLISSSS